MTKTHFKKLRDPNYVGSWDLMDKEGNVHDKIVTITGVEKKQVFDGKGGSEMLPTISFAECKPMVANSTNMKVVSRVCGSNFIEDWVGKKIRLTVKQIKAFGELHDAIRVDSKPVVLPELTQAHAKFEYVKNAVQNGTTREQVETTFKVSEAIWNLLKTPADVKA